MTNELKLELYTKSMLSEKTYEMITGNELRDRAKLPRDAGEQECVNKIQRDGGFMAVCYGYDTWNEQERK